VLFPFLVAIRDTSILHPRPLCPFPCSCPIYRGRRRQVRRVPLFPVLPPFSFPRTLRLTFGNAATTARFPSAARELKSSPIPSTVPLLVFHHQLGDRLLEELPIRSAGPPPLTGWRLLVAHQSRFLKDGCHVLFLFSEPAPRILRGHSVPFSF